MSSLLYRQLAARRALFSLHKFGQSTSVRFMSAFAKSYGNILTSRPEPGVALVTLNRPKALNALNIALFAELNDALRLIDADREIGAIVITGSERAFAGALRATCIVERMLTRCSSRCRYKGDEGQVL